MNAFSRRSMELLGLLSLAAALPASAQNLLYAGTGTVTYTVHCGDQSNTVTGTAEVRLLMTNASAAGACYGVILNPYLFGFPRQPAVEPIVASLDPAGFHREHSFIGNAPWINVQDADRLMCPPVGLQQYAEAGTYYNSSSTPPFDSFKPQIITYCVNNTCSDIYHSVSTEVLWQFTDIPLVGSTSTVFAGQVRDTEGQPVTNMNFFMWPAPGFQRSDFPKNPDLFWEDRGKLNIGPDGRFFTWVKGEGPIRVLAFHTDQYNGFSRMFRVPDTNAVLMVVSKGLVDYDCVLWTEGTVRAREQSGGVWGDWSDVHAGTRLTRPWHLATEADSDCLVTMKDANRDGECFTGPEAQLTCGLPGPLEPVFDFKPWVDGARAVLKLFLAAPKTNSLPVQFQTPHAVTSVHATGVRLTATGAVDVIEVANGAVYVTPTNSAQSWLVSPGRRFKTDGSAAWMETMTSNEWEELQAEVETLAWAAEPALRADFGDGRMPDWMRGQYGNWGVTPSNVLRNIGYKADDFPFALLDYECPDATLQADVRKIGGDEADVAYAYGMHLRSDGVESNFYEFSIAEIGAYMIGKYVGGAWTTLVSWRYTNALRTGFNTWNTLKAAARGTNLYFYANGHLLKTINDSSLTRGRFGFFSTDAASSTNADTVEFDNVVLIIEPPGRGAHPPVLIEQKPLPGGLHKLSWASQPAEWFTLRAGTNLLDGFVPYTPNIRGEFPVTTWTTAPPAGPGPRFFRVDRQ